MTLIVVVPMMLAGAVGGLLSGRLPASGQGAITLSVIPLLGPWLTTKFC